MSTSNFCSKPTNSDLVVPSETVSMEMSNRIPTVSKALRQYKNARGLGACIGMGVRCIQANGRTLRMYSEAGTLSLSLSLHTHTHTHTHNHTHTHTQRETERERCARHLRIYIPKSKNMSSIKFRVPQKCAPRSLRRSDVLGIKDFRLAGYYQIFTDEPSIWSVDRL